MIYDISSGNGFSDGASELQDEENVDPMSMVANVVDAMLVLSVGLMVAIVAYWNVDLPNVEEVVKADEVTAVDDIAEMSEQMQSENSSYTELGRVYQDPTTGQLYMLTEDVEKTNGDEGDAGDAD